MKPSPPNATVTDARSATVDVAINGRSSLSSMACASQDASEATKCSWSALNRQPPVSDIWRETAGRLWRRSMMKSWPLGLVADGFVDGGIDTRCRTTQAQRRPQIGGSRPAPRHI